MTRTKTPDEGSFLFGLLFGLVGVVGCGYQLHQRAVFRHVEGSVVGRLAERTGRNVAAYLTVQTEDGPRTIRVPFEAQRLCQDGSSFRHTVFSFSVQCGDQTFPDLDLPLILVGEITLLLFSGLVGYFLVTDWTSRRRRNTTRSTAAQTR